MPPRRLLVLTVVLLAALLATGAAAWITPRLEWVDPDPPWTDPLPTRAVDAGYAAFYRDRGGAVWKAWEDHFLDRHPPRPDGPLLIDTLHTSKQPWNAKLSMTAYGYGQMHGLARAFEPAIAAGIQLQPARWRYSGRTLAGASGVFINLPSGDNAALRTSEVYALVSFVRRGGGLVIVADHTNCYLHAELLAPLTRALGVTLPPVTAADPAHRLTPDSVSWVRIEQFAEHPLTSGVRALGMTTATAVEGLTPLAFTSGAGWWDGWEPYRRDDSSGLTGDLLQQGSERPGPAPVIAAGEVGDGRVVVLGDQNAWGATLVGYEDNARLFANAIGWALRRDVPSPARDHQAVTTVGAGCTSLAPAGYRTLQVQVQRWAAQSARPEGCVTGSPGLSDGIILLPQDAHADLDRLLSAPHVLAIVDTTAPITGALLDRLGLTLAAPDERRSPASWVVEPPNPDVPILGYGDDTLDARPAVVSGQIEPWMVDALGRTVVGRVHRARGEVILVLDPDLLNNTGLGGERDDPRTWRWFGGSTPRLAAHRLAHRLVSELFGP